eukprot:5359120-Alexandrium_andersonii.AAC.1
MAHQYGPFAGSLLGALVHEPAEVPAGNFCGLEPLAQPADSEFFDSDVPQDLQPRGNRRGSPL